MTKSSLIHGCLVPTCIFPDYMLSLWVNWMKIVGGVAL